MNHETIPKRIILSDSRLESVQRLGPHRSKMDSGFRLPEVSQDQETMNQFRDDQIIEIYRRIATGEEKHGSFLTSFADAIVRADLENFAELRERAIFFIKKYHLPNDS